jgi:hypothetical protein
MVRAVLVVSLVLSAAASAAEPCEPPRNRDTAPLATAAAQDKVVANAFEKAASTCAERGPACDQARLECGSLVTSIIQKQVGFDDGVWLRDMLLPYQGQSYAMTRSFGAVQVAADASCNVDVATLNAAALRRTKQASRRDGLLAEYQSYVKWTLDVLQKCKARVAADEQRSAEAKAESERLAASAAAASAATAAAVAAKRFQDEENRRKAEEQARLQEEARKRQEAQLTAQEEARRKQEETAARMKAEQERAKEDALAKASAAEEARIVAQRETEKENARKQKEALLAQAEEEEAAAARAAEQKTEALKKKAAGIEVKDDDERARGNISVMGVAGVLSGWAGTGTTTSFAIGAGLAAHLGFWGTAPAHGMASGFELRLSGRFVQTVSGTSANALEGLITGRYFFGHIGVGAAGALRFFDTFKSQSFDAGLSLAAAFMDTPRSRVLLGLNWLPVGTSMDYTRFAADFEVSYQYFTFHAHGGILTTPIAGKDTLGWEIGASLGARLGW